MARKPNVCPSYLLHKQSGQARVRIGGKEFLLGEYGSEESRVLYGELIAKHAGGHQIDPRRKNILICESAVEFIGIGWLVRSDDEFQINGQ
ncbi:MAG: hypothetical protein ACK6D4_10390 [Planctomyces sp.]